MNYPINLKTDLAQGLQKFFLKSPLVRNNKKAHTFNVTVVDGSTAVELGTISATFMNGKSAMVEIDNTLCTATGNVASVTLPEQCYTVPGSALLTINNITDDAVVCIALIFCQVANNISDSAVDPGDVIPSVSQLIAEIEEVRDSIPEDYTELVEEVNGKLDAPATPGTQGQVLTSDGNGGQTWEDATGGGDSPFESGAEEGSAQIKAYTDSVQTACGAGTTAIGKNTTAMGSGCHAEGTGTVAAGEFCHAEGQNYFFRRITVSSEYTSQTNVSYEDGIDTPLANSDVSSDTYLVIYRPDGYVISKRITSLSSVSKRIYFSGSVLAVLDNAKAVVTNYGAFGSYTHSEGSSLAIQMFTHAEGQNTRATLTAAHSEGMRTKASGNGSHAEGNTTEARSNYSHSEGNGTVAASNSQHVQGKYNEIDTVDTYAHIVGAGTSATNRKNIHTLDWSGNAWFAGSLILQNGEEMVTLTGETLKKIIDYINTL